MWCWRAKEVVERRLLDGTDECQASGWRRESMCESELIELTFGVFEKWQDVAHFAPFFRNQRTAKASSSASRCLACRVKVSKKEKAAVSCWLVIWQVIWSHTKCWLVMVVCLGSHSDIMPARRSQKWCVSLRCFSLFLRPSCSLSSAVGVTHD